MSWCPHCQQDLVEMDLHSKIADFWMGKVQDHRDVEIQRLKGIINEAHNLLTKSLDEYNEKVNALQTERAARQRLEQEKAALEDKCERLKQALSATETVVAVSNAKNAKLVQRDDFRNAFGEVSSASSHGTLADRKKNTERVLLHYRTTHAKNMVEKREGGCLSAYELMGNAAIEKRLTVDERRELNRRTFSFAEMINLGSIVFAQLVYYLEEMHDSKNLEENAQAIEELEQSLCQESWSDQTSQHALTLLGKMNQEDISNRECIEHQLFVIVHYFSMMNDPVKWNALREARLSQLREIMAFKEGSASVKLDSVFDLMIDPETGLCMALSTRKKQTDIYKDLTPFLVN